MSILHPSIEGKYEILGKLREGGMGAVYKVRHRLLDELRVVKVIRPHLEPSPDLSERFLREARAAIKLRHPHIAELHDFSIDEDGGAFIVLEFIAGATLEDLIKCGGPPPLGLALEIAGQALTAIGFLHRKGFVHRDIAPDNLMLTRDVEGRPLVKLIDLGIAKVLAGSGDLTVVGMFLGKPRYASPEQLGAAGTAGIDGRSDLYSFGAVLYELLTGRLPITGHDPSSLIAGHLFRSPMAFAESDPQERIPSDLRAIVERALAKRPEERFASAEELARSLAAVQARFPLAPGDVERSLRQAAAMAPIATQAISGPTQDELDRRFAPVLTPSPAIRTVRLSQATTAVPLRTAPPAKLPEPLESARERAPELDLPLLVRPRTGPEAPPAEPRPAPPPRRATLQSALPLALLAMLLMVGLGWIAFWILSSSPSPTTLRPANAPSALPGRPAVAPTGPARTETAPAPAPPALPTATSMQGPASPPPASASPTATFPRAPVAPTGPPAGARQAAAVPPAVSRSSPKGRQVVDVPVELAGETAGGPGREAPMKRGDLIVAGPGVEDPEGLSSPAPAYPPAAPSGRHARVVVEVLVNENGTVDEARIQSAAVDDGSADTEFRQAALAAARRARFTPATRDGIPGKAWGVLTYEFGTPKPR